MSLLGTSMPTAALPGIGGLDAHAGGRQIEAMSSARPVILLILTPAEGCSSYRVTAGPRLMSTIRVCTPKLWRVSTRRWAFWRSCSLSADRFRGGSLSSVMDGKIYGRCSPPGQVHRAPDPVGQGPPGAGDTGAGALTGVAGRAASRASGLLGGHAAE